MKWRVVIENTIESIESSGAGGEHCINNSNNIIINRSRDVLVLDFLLISNIKTYNIWYGKQVLCK